MSILTKEIKIFKNDKSHLRYTRLVIAQSLLWLLFFMVPGFMVVLFAVPCGSGASGCQNVWLSGWLNLAENLLDVYGFALVWVPIVFVAFIEYLVFKFFEKGNK